MPAITCPLCGAPVRLRQFFPAPNKPFCARCGWNLSRAEAGVNAQKTLFLFSVVFLAALGVAFALEASHNRSPALFLIPSLFGLIALAPLFGYFSMRRAIAEAKLTARPEFAQAQPVSDPSLQYLVSLPRPRRVRFRFVGSAAIVVAFGIAFLTLGILVLVATSAKHSSRHPGDISVLIPLFFMLLVFAALVGVPLVREKRNRPLLRDGELAFARVHSQEQIQQGKTSYSHITFSFQTGGVLIQGSARDLSGRVFEDMTIPVFYDPLNPSRNIPLCATYLKLDASL